MVKVTIYCAAIFAAMASFGMSRADVVSLQNEYNSDFCERFVTHRACRFISRTSSQEDIFNFNEEVAEEELDMPRRGPWKKWTKKTCLPGSTHCNVLSTNQSGDDVLMRYSWDYKDRRDHPNYQKCLKIKSKSKKQECKRAHKKAFKKCADVEDPVEKRLCKRIRLARKIPKKCRDIQDVKERSKCIKKHGKEKKLPKKCRKIDDPVERNQCVQDHNEAKQERRFPKKCMGISDPQERLECVKKAKEDRKARKSLQAEGESVNSVDPTKMSRKAFKVYCALYPEKRICQLF